MVKDTNLSRLRQTLKNLAGKRRLTLKVVCEEAGVSPATAKRSPDFLDEFKAAKAQSRRSASRDDDGVGAAEGGGSKAKVKSLQASVDLLANLVHALRLVNDDLLAENRRLHAEQLRNVKNEPKRLEPFRQVEAARCVKVRSKTAC